MKWVAVLLKDVMGVTVEAVTVQGVTVVELAPYPPVDSGIVPVRTVPVAGSLDFQPADNQL